MFFFLWIIDLFKLINLKNIYSDLSIATSSPPIKDRFLVIARIWNGTRWKIIVVGTIKIKSNEQANLILLVKIRSTQPLIKRAIAIDKSSIEIGSGKPLPTMYWVWTPKLVILPGIAFIKIALRNNLPRKFNE